MDGAQMTDAPLKDLYEIGEIPPLAIRDVTAPDGSDALKSRRRVWFSGGGEGEAQAARA